MELVVADPSTATSSNNANFQSLFTKQNPNSGSLAFQDICMRLLKQNDDLRSGTKFVLKQFMLESGQMGQRSFQMLRTLEALKQENTTLKQAHNSQRIRMEQAVEDLQQKLTSAQKKLEEKDRQLMQFRQLHNTMTPQSPRGSNGGRPSSVESRRVSGGEGQQQRSMNMEPPLKGFMMQKEANERAKQLALEQPQRTPLLGGGAGTSSNHHQHQHHHNSHHSGRPQSDAGVAHHPSYMMAPASHHQSQQQQQRPYSTGSGGSGGNSSGIRRDLTSSSGYVFSGSSSSQQQQVSKRHRGQPPSNNARSMSPSQAFGSNHVVTSSAGRGPSNYFQQQGGYNRR
jgi:hypothetical protein